MTPADQQAEHIRQELEAWREARYAGVAQKPWRRGWLTRLLRHIVESTWSDAL